MTDTWDELWKEEKYMTSEDVPTDFYNLMMKVKAEGDRLQKQLKIGLEAINLQNNEIKMLRDNLPELKEKAEKWEEFLRNNSDYEEIPSCSEEAKDK